VQEAEPEAPTLAAFVEERWLPVYPEAAGYRERTKSINAWALNHVRPVLGARRPTEIDPEALAELVTELRAKNLSDKSVKLICGQLRKVLATAEEWGALPSVPRFPKIKTPDRGFEYLSREEGAAVVNAARAQEERALLLFALDTGARVGEQAALEWGDVDWQRHEVIIRRSRPSGTKTVGPTKNSKGRRIPLTTGLEAALKQARHLKGELVFCGPGGEYLETDQFRHVFEAARKRAGVRRVTWHCLRHSFASQAVASGVPLNVVQAWLGHSTIAMTMKYAHLAPDGGAEWIRALEQPQRQPDGNLSENVG